MSGSTTVSADPSQSKASIPSPCIGICEMDEATGQCTGCARTRDEIKNWRDGTDEWRQSIWAALPDRLSALGVTVQRLQMTTDNILDFIDNSISGARGTWVLGVYGGVGEFNRDPDEPCEISRDQNVITAVTSRAALRFVVSSASRLLRVDGETPGDPPRAYCLAVHRSRVNLPALDGLTCLGKDDGAIRPGDRNAHLFDLGLGRDKARFFVRTRNPEMLETLHNAEGLPLKDMLGQAGSTLLKLSPGRVIETGVGRVEVETPIPPPGERSSAGPHTHLLPGHLAENINGAPGLAIPDAYAIGALFYPKRNPPLDSGKS